MIQKYSKENSLDKQFIDFQLCASLSSLMKSNYMTLGTWFSLSSVIVIVYATFTMLYGLLIQGQPKQMILFKK